LYENYVLLLNGYRGEFDIYWADFGSIEAVNILDKFSQQDWEVFTKNLPNQNENWLVACAETLSEVKTSDIIFQTLETLLNKSSHQVILATLDTIHTMIQQKVELPNHIKELVIATLDHIKEHDKTEEILTLHLKIKI
jgi:hypothetical protein